MLSRAERRAGVVAMSAGNHAQAVARHASLLGIAATIVMPLFTPATKVTRTARLGRRASSCTATPWPRPPPTPHAGRASTASSSSTPTTTTAVMAGQGTLALELLQDAPDSTCCWSRSAAAA